MYMKMEKQMFDKQKLGPEETTGHREDPGLQALPSVPHHTQPIFFADLSGNYPLEILGTRPPFKFFQAVRAKVKGSS